MNERAGLYVRVSTEDQTVVTQLDSLTRRASELGFIVPDGQTYSDSGVSGRGDSRPEFDRLREAIRSRSVDVVLVTKLDRIARSVRSALEFFDDADAAGVRIVVTDQAIDTATPAGRLTRTILAGVAEFEVELIGDRTRAALAAIRSGARKTRTGNPIGRPRRVTLELAKRAAHLRGAGLKWKEVAQRVGLPAETCRKAVWQVQHAAGGVENSAPSGTVRSTPEEGPR